MLKYEFWLRLWMGFGIGLGLGVKERGCARIRNKVLGGVRV